MTGYGSASRELAGGGSVTVEMRSVNQRHLRVTVKGPASAEAREAELRDLVGARLSRGRVDVYVSVDRGDSAGRRVLDEERVRDLLDAARRLGEEFGVRGDPDVNTLLATGGLLKDVAADEPVEIPDDTLAAAVEVALAELIQMREAEGSRLDDDLRSQLTALDEGLDAAEALAPDRLERERDRLRAAVAELTDGRELEPDRLAREIALIADRWDVGEELVRARSHIAAFREYLDSPAAEPVGKRLGFLVQELQREINTLGAKANHTMITRHVVEMKNHIEKLREQVENVE